MLSKDEIYQALNDTFNHNPKWKALSAIGKQAILAIELQAKLDKARVFLGEHDYVDVEDVLEILESEGE